MALPDNQGRIDDGYLREKTYWDNFGVSGVTCNDSMLQALALLGFNTGSTQDRLNAFKASGIAPLPLGTTFNKDYTNTTNVNADYAVGSPTATFTASRDATTPATYIDSSGIIRLTTTSNIPRFAGGYYDTTGFHSAKGLMMEAAGTNLLVRTDGTASGAGLWTGWTDSHSTANTPTFSQVAIPELTLISGANSQRVVYVDGADVNKGVQIQSTNTANASVAPDDVMTLSFWARSQTGITGCLFSGAITWRNDVGGAISTTATDFTLTTAWQKCIVTGTAPALTDRVGIKFGASGGVAQGDTLDFEVYGIQVEKNPYATSFIPTTTAALTRNAETLTYPIAGNRTAATETIAIKFMPEWAGTDIAATNTNRLMETDTKDRRITQSATSDQIFFAPNISDSGASTKATGVTVAKNTSTVVTCIAYGATGDPNTGIKDLSGSLLTANDDWTVPAWGTKFYVGGNNGSSNCLIQKVAIFNRALLAGEVSQITTLLGT